MPPLQIVHYLIIHSVIVWNLHSHSKSENGHLQAAWSKLGIRSHVSSRLANVSKLPRLGSKENAAQNEVMRLLQCIMPIDAASRPKDTLSYIPLYLHVRCHCNSMISKLWHVYKCSTRNKTPKNDWPPEWWNASSKSLIQMKQRTVYLGLDLHTPAVIERIYFTTFGHCVWRCTLPGRGRHDTMSVFPEDLIGSPNMLNVYFWLWLDRILVNTQQSFVCVCVGGGGGGLRSHMHACMEQDSMWVLHTEAT